MNLIAYPFNDTWITNFTSDCTLTLDGASYKVSGAVVVPGYYTYHAVVSASLNAAHTYSISGKGTSVTKSFRYNDSNRYLICGDPQIIDQSSADVWYKVQKVLDPLPAIIISILTKNPCYTAGRKITVKGLMLHSVGCPQPRASVFISSWNSASFDRACVHGFIDGNDGTVYQTLPWNHRGWHCGSSINGSANNTHIGVEMCEPACITYR